MYLRGKKKHRNELPAPARTKQLPFTCSHFTPKNMQTKHNVSRSGILPTTSPLQHSCGHYNVICTTKWQTKMYLRTWQHNMETIIQPLQCDLQPRIPQDHRTTHISQSHKFTTSPLLHFSKSPLLQVITSLSHHFPKSTHCTKPSLLLVTTSQSLKVTISLSQPTSQSHTNVFVRNSEDCLPTSFDNHDFPPKVYGSTTCVDLQYCITMHDQPFDPTAEACDKQYAF